MPPVREQSGTTDLCQSVGAATASNLLNTRDTIAPRDCSTKYDLCKIPPNRGLVGSDKLFGDRYLNNICAIALWERWRPCIPV